MTIPVEMRVGALEDSAYTGNSPARRIVRTVNRNWTDTDGDRVVDCDLLNFRRHGECQALTGNSLNFGNDGDGLTEVNQDTLHGWGVRG